MERIIKSDFFENAQDIWVRELAEKTLSKVPDKSSLSNIDPFERFGDIVQGDWRGWHSPRNAGYRSAWWLRNKSGEWQVAGIYSFRRRYFKKTEFGVFQLQQHQIRIIRWKSSEVFIFLNDKLVGTISCKWGFRRKGEIIHNDQKLAEVKLFLLNKSRPYRDKIIDIKLADGNVIPAVVYPALPRSSFNINIADIFESLRDDTLLQNPPHQNTSSIFPNISQTGLAVMTQEIKALLLGTIVWLIGRSNA